MSIAYYAQTADIDHWDGVWAEERLDRLVAVAHRDPLTTCLEDHLPGQGLILEGGCGLGQYVVYLRDRGYNVVGGDFSLKALRVHREVRPDSPLLCLDLCRIPVADGAFQAHVSIGVVEHIQEGPQELLHEFYRTLAPGGILLLSVPWVNVYRRLTRPFIVRRQARLRGEGAHFYQYALARREVRAFLAEAGFRVRAFYPYSPARGMREVPVLRRTRSRPPEAKTVWRAGDRAAPVQAPLNCGVQGVRRLLYWPPVLWAFAHMILAVAEKPES